MGVLSQLIVPQWGQPELALSTPTALGLVKHATCRDPG